MATKVEELVLAHKKRTLQVFRSNLEQPLAEDFESHRTKVQCKIYDEYRQVKDLPPPTGGRQAGKTAAPPASSGAVSASAAAAAEATATAGLAPSVDADGQTVLGTHAFPSAPGVPLTEEQVGDAPVSAATFEKYAAEAPQSARAHEQGKLAASLADIRARAGAPERYQPTPNNRALIPFDVKPLDTTKPEWHAPWKLMRVISGHTGWIRSVAIDPSNRWFATGSADRTIKIWDLASGTLRLTLTGHINAVRGLAISDRSPYLFSAGEDKQVKCWDLEQNKVVRHYHGHLSGVYCLALHPTLDVMITGGRDSCGRVWDIRTKAQVHLLAGHTSTVASVTTQSVDPQVITGSHDQTMRLWDLAAGKVLTTLTHHKKSIRAQAMHPTEFSFASGAADNLKHWKLPEGRFMKNFSGHNAVINCLALNRDNVLVSGADNGSLYFWDWKSGYNFQQLQSKPQPGSLDSEAGIFASTFDFTGSRLITCEADKTIKFWCEDDTATPETHPINWKATRVQKRF